MLKNQQDIENMKGRGIKMNNQKYNYVEKRINFFVSIGWWNQ